MGLPGGARPAGRLRDPARRQQHLRELRQSRLRSTRPTSRRFPRSASGRSTSPATRTAAPTCSTPTAKHGVRCEVWETLRGGDPAHRRRREPRRVGTRTFPEWDVLEAESVNALVRSPAQGPAPTRRSPRRAAQSHERIPEHSRSLARLQALFWRLLTAPEGVASGAAELVREWRARVGGSVVPGPARIRRSAATRGSIPRSGSTSTPTCTSTDCATRSRRTFRVSRGASATRTSTIS